MKVAIVGPAGFIGRRVVSRLRESGITVWQLSSRDGTGLDPHTGVLAASAGLLGVEAVLFLAQSPFYRETPRRAAHLMRINVAAAVDAAERARAAGVRRFVYASTATVYRPSFRPLREHDPLERRAWYPLSKIQAEEALGLFDSDMEVHRARMFLVYGEGQRNRLVPSLVGSIHKRRAVFLEPAAGATCPDGGLRCSMLHVDDAARLLARLCVEGGPTLVNLASPESASIRELTELAAAHLGVEPRFVISERRRPGDFVADGTRLGEWDRAPFIPMTEGIERVIDCGHGR